MHFAVALEADGEVELLRGSVIAARQQLEAVERVYFFAVFLREGQHFPRDAPPAILGTNIDLRYLGHIFVVAERFFQLNADEAGEPSSVAVRNDDNLALFVRSEARMLSSVVLPLPLNSALRRSSSPASPTDANLTIFISPRSFTIEL